ncbi:hypothetical protein BU14_1604s0001 [Porphyra umbilicalis]|uniref:Uncharacterized protein n=1 Tax=Porphyra umbilicalis TaxID=2786 RepID=A0A1X6NL26_PORUM|nr:hypothetical protein BU14_1604s0001 [Porphyra umbilicalis]|eukprot:OSX69341.1 hypothetical protein BU14_1604s0001 [Porphyra umbilicalis]
MPFPFSFWFHMHHLYPHLAARCSSYRPERDTGARALQ